MQQEMSFSRQNEIPIDSKLYKAAVGGRFEELERYAHSLDCLVNSNEETILHIHLKSRAKRSAEFVQKVVDKCPQLLKQTNENCDTPLHIAARTGHPEMVKLLIQLAKTRDLESGREPIEEARKWIRMVNKDKDTALHEAVRWNNVGVVEEILGVEDLEDKYGVNSSGETPMYLAAHCRSFNSLRVMLEAYKHKPVAYQGPDGKTVLHAAIQFCGPDTTLNVIESIESLVNEADESGWTPLHYAVCIPNSSSVVSKMLEKDTRSAFMKDNDRKRTPIHLAACLGNSDAMKIFISVCPECAELTDYRGWNACHFAAISKSSQTFQLILEDDSLAHLLKCKDVNGYYPRDYLQVLDMYSLRQYTLDGESPDAEEKMEEWTKDLGNGPDGKLVAGALAPNEKSPKDKRKEMEDKIIPELEKAKDSHLVAAALVATVTFAAAFTLPGGYISDENKSNNLKLGSPILSRNVAFQAFVITNGIALVLSTSSVFIHFIMVMLGYKQKYYWLMRSAFWCIVFAMGAIVVAFVTGTYAVLMPDSFWLALLTCLIGLAFFINAFYTVIRLIKNHEDWYLNTAPRYLCCDCCQPLCITFVLLCMLIFLPIYGLPLMIYKAWKRPQIRRHTQSKLSSELRS